MNEYIPPKFYLGQNYPNPFTDKTSIKYCVPYKIKVKITVFNSEGEIIKKIVDEVKDAGTYEVEFSALEKNKESFKSETYFYCFEACSFSNTKSMILNKNLFKEV